MTECRMLQYEHCKYYESTQEITTDVLSNDWDLLQVWCTDVVTAVGLYVVLNVSRRTGLTHENVQCSQIIAQSK